jgi:2-hydroxy-6-oxonona-2,4-dienedioate hydrolase
MPPISSRIEKFTVDSRPVRCRILGTTPGNAAPALYLPLFFLHGLGCSSDSWQPALDRMAERQPDSPVYAPDMPGFGCSPGPRAALGMEDLGDWVVRLMDALGVQRAHLAANSMGCQVALAIARRHPERVGGIVLVGPTAGERYIPFWRYALGLVLDGVREPFVYTAVLTRMYVQMGLIRYLETTKKMLEDEPINHAAEVDAPCLILRGGNDGIIPDAVARRLAAALPKGEFRRLPGASHALQFSRPVEFLEIALTFWERTEA